MPPPVKGPPPLVIVAIEPLLAADHEQDDAVVTVTVPVPPLAVKDAVVGETLYEHAASVHPISFNIPIVIGPGLWMASR